MRHILITLTLLFTLILFNASFARASEIERPSLLEDFFMTETVYPQGEGETQLTFSLDHSSFEEGKLYSLTAAVEYGVTGQFQLQAEGELFKQLEPEAAGVERGTGDISLGCKYTFDSSAAEEIQVAVGVDVVLPTGNDKVTENAYVYEPFVVLSRDLGEDANLHLSLSYGFVDPKGKGAEGADEVAVSLGTVYRLNQEWRLTLEASHESNKLDDGDESESYLTPGLIWKGMEDIEIGLAVACGLGEDSADWRGLGMVSFEF